MEIMKFDNVQDIRNEGFKGFRTAEELMESKCSPVPKVPGVYFVIRHNESPVIFLQKSIGGRFKGENPTVTIDELKNNWVKNSIVLNIGKAGGRDSKATLQSRLWQYMQFGMGKPIGHKGGRYIWQIKDSNKLIICWKELLNVEPVSIEKEYISKFKGIYGCRPFANLRD